MGRFSVLGKAARRVGVVVGAGVLFAGVLMPLPQAVAAKGTALDDVGYYPRVIRLANNGDANGQIIASTVSRGGNNHKVGRIYRSTDGGKSFNQISRIKDPRAAQGRGMCCATLYELPRGVGKLKRGTLIWAGTFGGGMSAKDRRMSIRVWTSTDQGRSWRFLSTMAAAANSKPLWEPEFTVTGSGALAGFYSSEARSPRNSQVLRKVFTRDGRSWSRPQELVVINSRPSARAGMAVPMKVSNKHWVMAYEICNLDYVRQCAIYTRNSTDGWHWGTPNATGKKVVTSRGNYPTHTPYLTRVPGRGMVLSGQLLVRSNGRFAAGNGRTLLMKPFEPNAKWREVPAPVSVPGARNDFCPNFSNSVLPSKDGRSALQISSDYDGPVCRPYFRSGPLR